METLNASPVILIVDDSEANRYVLRRTFETGGYDVIMGDCGQDALKLAKQLPALIVLDVNLPDSSGYEITRRLKADEATKQIPILNISADFLSYSDDIPSDETGADGYLSQPIDSKVLLASAKALLRARSAEEAQAKLLAESKAQLLALSEERTLRDRFVTALTHDLRSHLSTSKMASGLLDEDAENPKEVRQLGRLIERNLEAAILLIEDLLDANRLKAGQKPKLVRSECDLAQIANDVIEDLSAQHGSRVRIFGDKKLIGMWDCRAIRRILENLTSNALKYGSVDQPVTITVKRMSSSRATLIVHNRGETISSSDQLSIFKLFERTTNAQKSGSSGWGIGLSIVKGLTEAHGGSVRVESLVDEGTSFIVTLPIVYTAEADIQTRVPRG